MARKANLLWKVLLIQSFLDRRLETSLFCVMVVVNREVMRPPQS